ncbi:MAG: flagellar type III secretion system pore protein FliP, partial [Alphaproteobacteria bacterium]
MIAAAPLSDRAGRWLARVLPVATLLLVMATPAMGQSLDIDFGEGGSATGRLVQLLLILTVLTLAPSIIIMVTSFTRIIVVLSFLRNAIGMPQTPPNMVMVSLALFLTAFIMAPTLERAYDEALVPLMAEEIDEAEAFERASGPVRDFMLRHVRPQDLNLFLDISGAEPVTSAEATPLRALVPAFM